jgi:hypothetical protein
MGLPQQSPINLAHPIVIDDFGKDSLDIQWKESAQGKVTVDEHGY